MKCKPADAGREGVDVQREAIQLKRIAIQEVGGFHVALPWSVKALY